MAKVIKTATEYHVALAAVDQLLARDPKPGTSDGDELEVLALLVREYEGKTEDVGLPDPLAAVEFRMEQQGLRQKDLVPYMGNKSKVSEVLSGKRRLTLKMIRALHNGLGIPAEVLLQEQDPAALMESDVEWARFPVREMIKRKWIIGQCRNLRDEAEDLLRPFFAGIGGAGAAAALYSKSQHVRAQGSTDHYALTAWTAQVHRRAIGNRPTCDFETGSVTLEFMRRVARLSWSDQGPLLAKEYLDKHGIALVIERHLPKTYLDGAALFSPELNAPVVALTLRHDRIDNFWFCLMHELAHVACHLKEGGPDFFDDLDVEPGADGIEAEADQMARAALIPPDAWNNSAARRERSPEAAMSLATELGIHPAIVAGQIRYSSGSYALLSPMVGQGQVRELFTEHEAA